MKSRMLPYLTAIALLAVPGVAVRLVAQNEPSKQSPRYIVIRLGTLAGTVSGGNSINNLGWITGSSDLAGNQVQHAALWTYGLTIDLGTLGGPNSAVAWPNHNNQGAIAGIAETAAMDQYGEDWSCSAFFPFPPTHHVCYGFVWSWGQKIPMPTLGGDNSYAAGMNNRGQVVGWAETAVHDSTCVLPQVLQFEGVIWTPGNNQLQVLPPLGGDPDSAATEINDQGQAVGISGICQNAVGDLSAKNAVIWENGAPTKIGNLGGSGWNTAAAINNQGVVVGFSDLTGDDNGNNFNAHAFIWTKQTGIHDLHTLAGDTISEATGINDQNQIVGLSCVDNTFANCSAVLWQNGVITDLNHLVVNNSSLHLYYANDINSFGVIAGQAIDTNTGDAYAFLGVPLGDHDSSALLPSSVKGTTSSSRSITLPEDVRQQLLRRMGLRP